METEFYQEFAVLQKAKVYIKYQNISKLCNLSIRS